MLSDKDLWFLRQKSTNLTTLAVATFFLIMENLRLKIVCMIQLFKFNAKLHASDLKDAPVSSLLVAVFACLC